MYQHPTLYRRSLTFDLFLTPLKLLSNWFGISPSVLSTGLPVLLIPCEVPVRLRLTDRIIDLIFRCSWSRWDNDRKGSLSIWPDYKHKLQIFFKFKVLALLNHTKRKALRSITSSMAAHHCATPPPPLEKECIHIVLKVFKSVFHHREDPLWVAWPEILTRKSFLQPTNWSRNGREQVR